VNRRCSCTRPCSERNIYRAFGLWSRAEPLHNAPKLFPNHHPSKLNDKSPLPPSRDSLRLGSLTSSIPIFASRPPPFVYLCLRLVRTMASTLRPASRLVVGPYTASTILRQATDRSTSPFLRAATTAAYFHSSSPRYALPSGPPPQGYRLPRPKRFDEGEHVLDKASNYFLLTEMFRGMYVVLEQFFRPPYVFLFLEQPQKWS